MKLFKKRIGKIAEDYINSQSFGYSSFSEAKYTLSFGLFVRKFIVFDRLSLCIYEHNLSHDEYELFCKERNRLYIPRNNDYDKCRIEYGILFHYLICKPTLADYIVTKTERPDFELKKGEHSIGIEITQLTTPYEKVMDRIVSMSGKGISVDELKTKAEARHGKKANDYNYHNINGTSVVGTKTLRPDNIREMFVQQILNKYGLYETKIEEYNDFVILCNAQQGITITEAWEADEIHDMLLQYSFDKSFCLAILWHASQLMCSEYQFCGSK